MYKPLIAALFVVLFRTGFAQSDSTRIELTGYIDTYYASYSNSLPVDQLQPYVTVSPRDNQFGLNIAEIGATYNTGQVRGTFVIQYGDIAEATWSDRFRAIQEAWVGLQVIEGLWLDGGFFTTHIGAESFLPKNNYLSSTDIGTFNEPFYQSGARLSYKKSNRFAAQLHIVSGYNLFIDNNSSKSWGLLLHYQVSDQLGLTYSNLYGRESPDGVERQRRFYQNIFADWDPTERTSIVFGGDFSSQTNSSLVESTSSAYMYNAFVTARYRFYEKCSITGRFEVFDDESGFISGVEVNRFGSEQGLQLTAFTLGLEYAPSERSYVRAESRWTRADADLQVFKNKGLDTNVRTEFMINMGFYFNKRL